MIRGFGAMVSALGLLFATATAVAAQEVSGTVDHIDPSTGVVYFNDGRIVHLEPGATLWIDGRQVTINDLRKGNDVMVEGAKATAAGPAPTVTPQAIGHPLVDVAGTVKSFDQQTGILTFQDGRMVMITDRTTTWQPVATGALQPGAQVFVDNAVPAGYRSSAVNWPADQRTYMGTVMRVDQKSTLIVLDNGTVVRVRPDTRMQMGAKKLTLPDLQPGDQVVVRARETATSGQSAQAVGRAGGQAAESGEFPSAFPRNDHYRATIEAEDIHLFRQHQAP